MYASSQILAYSIPECKTVNKWRFRVRIHDNSQSSTLSTHGVDTRNDPARFKAFDRFLNLFIAKVEHRCIRRFERMLAAMSAAGHKDNLKRSGLEWVEEGLDYLDPNLSPQGS